MTYLPCIQYLGEKKECKDILLIAIIQISNAHPQDSSLDKILLNSKIGEGAVFTLDTHTMKIEKILDGDYHSSACSDTHLYLSNNEQNTSNVNQYKLSNLELCRYRICTEDESISFMAYNSDMLALIIFDHSWKDNHLKVQPRFEVRSTTRKLEKL